MYLTPYRNRYSQISEMMDSMQNWMRGTTEGNSMPINVTETETDILVEAALPGMHEDDINVVVTDDVLTISAESRFENEQADEERGWHRREFRYGKVSRSVRLPSAVDSEKADADLENGVLTITLPKTDVSPIKRIAVNAKKLISSN